MFRSNDPARRNFLGSVDGQLVGLDYFERREILDELDTHMSDIEEQLVASGSSEIDATSRAISTMGDPAAIGAKLREEHLAKRLVLRDALLAGLPLLILGAIVAFVPVLNELRSLWGSHSDPTKPLLVLGAMLTGSVWLLRRAEHGFFAVLTGILAVYTLIPVTRFVQVTSAWPTSALWLLLFLLIAGPGMLAFVVRFGAFRASLSLLGGVGGYGVYAWGGRAAHAVFQSHEVSYLLVSLPLVVVPFLGIVAIGVANRRWLFVVGGGALLANWSVILLYHTVQFGAQIGPMPQLELVPTYVPPLHMTQLISFPVLIATCLALLGVNGWVRLQDRAAIRAFIDRLPAC